LSTNKKKQLSTSSVVPLKLVLQLENHMKNEQKLSKQSKQVVFSAAELMTPY